MGVLKLVNSRQLRNLRVPNLTLAKCHNDSSSSNDDDKKEVLEAPTTCCMSGCPNCVWIDYAEKLSELYKDGGEEAEKQIKEKVTDPNLQAYLLHELRMKKPK